MRLRTQEDYKKALGMNGIQAIVWRLAADGARHHAVALARLQGRRDQ